MGEDVLSFHLPHDLRRSQPHAFQGGEGFGGVRFAGNVGELPKTGQQPGFGPLFHGIQVAADLLSTDVPMGEVDMLVLPGGMPGVKNLDASPVTQSFIDATLRNGGHLAAICAAPSIFGRHGMLTNIKATCFPGFEGDLLNAIVTDRDVVTDGVFTTARDYKCATAFAEELIRICEAMGIEPKDESEVIEEAK